MPQLTPLTPRLTAYDKASYALIVSAVPGVLAQELVLTVAQELELYRQAGNFLRAFHELPLKDDDKLTLDEAFAMRFEAWKPRFAPLLKPAKVDWVKGKLTEAMPLLRQLQRVPTHRDYSSRNWLLDLRKGIKLWVIDFEHSRPDLCLNDFVRLWSEVWSQRPDLHEAFFDGCGQDLSADEEELLATCAAIDALITVAWAYEHNDAEFERQARVLLSRLAQDS